MLPTVSRRKAMVNCEAAACETCYVGHALGHSQYQSHQRCWFASGRPIQPSAAAYYCCCGSNQRNRAYLLALCALSVLVCPVSLSSMLHPSTLPHTIHFRYVAAEGGDCQHSTVWTQRTTAQLHCGLTHRPCPVVLSHCVSNTRLKLRCVGEQASSCCALRWNGMSACSIRTNCINAFRK